MRSAIVLIVGLWMTPIPLHAQMLQQSLTAPDVPTLVQARRAEKSVALAAILSWFVWPGVGSYYAGNSAHGTRHVLIGVGTAAGALVLLATCDSDGFCDFHNDTARLTVVSTLIAGFVANQVWGIITAIHDAEDFNLNIASASISLKPEIRPLATALPMSPQWGIRFASVSF